MSKIYRVGDPYVLEYENPPVPKNKQYKRGQYITIQNVETKKKMVKINVSGSDEEKVTGTVIVTYAHNRKRANNEQS